MRFSQSLYQMNAGTESRRTSISPAAVGSPTRRRPVARRRTVLIASIGVMQWTRHIDWLAPSDGPTKGGEGTRRKGAQRFNHISVGTALPEPTHDDIEPARGNHRGQY